MGALYQIKHLRNWFERHGTVTATSVMIFLTVAGEILVESEFFLCPCSKDEARDYTLVFVLVPAALLFMASVLVNSAVWRNCYGCCGSNTEGVKQRPDGCCQWFWFFWTRVVSWSLLPIGCWAIVLLLDGDYLACALTDNQCSKEKLNPKYEFLCAEAQRRNECAKSKTDEYREWARLSQYIGWGSFGLVAALGLLALLCKRCCTSKPSTYLRHQFEEIKQGAEEIIVMEKMKNYAGILKADNCETFLKENLEKEDIDDVDSKIKKNQEEQRERFVKEICLKMEEEERFKKEQEKKALSGGKGNQN